MPRLIGIGKPSARNWRIAWPIWNNENERKNAPCSFGRSSRMRRWMPGKSLDSWRARWLSKKMPWNPEKNSGGPRPFWTREHRVTGVSLRSAIHCVRFCRPLGAWNPKTRRLGPGRNVCVRCYIRPRNWPGMRRIWRISAYRISRQRLCSGNNWMACRVCCTNTAWGLWRR